MRPLRDLLTTWENWSARDTLTRAIGRARTDDARETLRWSLANAPEVDPLDALRDAAELVALLSSWKWQAMAAARDAGASWNEVGAAVGASAAQVEAEYTTALGRATRYDLGGA